MSPKKKQRQLPEHFDPDKAGEIKNINTSSKKHHARNNGTSILKALFLQ
jgi:hypothetical protein